MQTEMSVNSTILLKIILHTHMFNVKYNITI